MSPPRRPRRGDREGSIRRRANGRFEGRVQLGGHRFSFYGDTAPEVRTAIRKAREAHEQGLDVETAETPLGDYLSTWLETIVRHKRPQTYRSYEVAVRVHIIPHPASRPLGQIPLGKLRPAHIEAWIADRRASGLAPSTLAHHRGILCTGLQRALKADVLLKNPVRQTEAIHVDEEEVQPLSQAEARRVLAAADGSITYALYALDLSLGLRQGELLGLRWRDIDLEQRLVYVRSQHQLGRLSPLKRTWHRRTLVLSPWLVTVLEAHAELLRERRQLAGQKWLEQDLVFPTATGRPHGPSSVRATWSRVLRRAGLAYTKFHNLRHTAASLALQAGVPLWQVSKMLGHRDIATTFRVYSHLTPEGREDVAERMQQILQPRSEPTGVPTGVQPAEAAPIEIR